MKYILILWASLVALFYGMFQMTTTNNLFKQINQLLRTGKMWHKVNFFKRSLTGLNSKFSFS